MGEAHSSALPCPKAGYQVRLAASWPRDPAEREPLAACFARLRLAARDVAARSRGAGAPCCLLRSASPRCAGRGREIPWSGSPLLLASLGFASLRGTWPRDPAEREPLAACFARLRLAARDVAARSRRAGAPCCLLRSASPRCAGRGRE